MVNSSVEKLVPKTAQCRNQKPLALHDEAGGFVEPLAPRNARTEMTPARCTTPMRIAKI